MIETLQDVCILKIIFLPSGMQELGGQQGHLPTAPLAFYYLELGGLSVKEIKNKSALLTPVQ